MAPLDHRDTDARLQSALQHVSEADERLLQSADAAQAKARSALTSAAIAIGLGAAIALVLGGATGRRKLASSLLGLAVPVVASMAARLLEQRSEQRSDDRREAVMRWENEGGTPTAVQGAAPLPENLPG
jgi:hypothetical protein